MSDKMVVGGSSITASQLKDFFRQIDDGSITGTIVQGILEHRNPFPEKVMPAVIPQSPANGGVTFAFALDTEAFLDDWSKFLQDVFKISLPSRKKFILPQTRPGFGWGIITPKGMTIEKVLQSSANIYPIGRWTNDNLDNITKSVRKSDNTRVVWVRDRIEADEEHKNKSYNDLQTVGIGSMTLLERLLLGRWFYYKTNKLLDTTSVTLCAGSLFSGGDVPIVGWSGYYGGLFVSRCSPDDRCDGLRVREVVSVS